MGGVNETSPLLSHVHGPVEQAHPLEMNRAFVRLEGEALSEELNRRKVQWAQMYTQDPDGSFIVIRYRYQQYTDNDQHVNVGKKAFDLFCEIAGLTVSKEYNHQAMKKIKDLRWWGVPLQDLLIIRPFYFKKPHFKMHGDPKIFNLTDPDIGKKGEGSNPFDPFVEQLLAVCLERYDCFHPERTSKMLNLPLAVFLRTAPDFFSPVKTAFETFFDDVPVVFGNLGDVQNEFHAFLLEQEKKFSNVPMIMKGHVPRWHGRRVLSEALLSISVFLGQTDSVREMLYKLKLKPSDNGAQDKKKIIKELFSMSIAKLLNHDALSKENIANLRKTGWIPAYLVRLFEAALLVGLGVLIVGYTRKTKAGHDRVDACLALAWASQSCRIQAGVCTIAGLFNENILPGSSAYFSGGEYTSLFSPWAGEGGDLATLEGTTNVFNAVGRCFPGASLSVNAIVSNVITGEPQTCTAPLPIACSAGSALRGAMVIAAAAQSDDPSSPSYFNLILMGVLLVAGVMLLKRLFSGGVAPISERAGFAVDSTLFRVVRIEALKDQEPAKCLI